MVPGGTEKGEPKEKPIMSNKTLDIPVPGGIAYVEPSQLRLIPALQSRVMALDEDAVSSMAEDIVANDQHEPVGGYYDTDGAPVLLYGGRRYAAACQIAKSDKDFRLAMFVRPKMEGLDALTANVGENRFRVDLSPVELAETARRFKEDYGLKQKDIATRMNASAPSVTQWLKLTKLVDEARKMLHSGTMTMEFALELLEESGGDEDKQREIIKEAKRQAKAATSGSSGSSSGGSEPGGGRVTKKARTTKQVRAEIVAYAGERDMAPASDEEEVELTPLEKEGWDEDTLAEQKAFWRGVIGYLDGKKTLKQVLNLRDKMVGAT